MAQWINLNWNNSFVNCMQLPLFCEKSGAILLELASLTAGQWESRQADWQAGRQSDKILIDLNIF